MADNEKREKEARGADVETETMELPEIDDSKGDGKKNPANRDLNLKMILDIPVDVRVELGHAVLSIGEILRLGPGAIVSLDRLTGSPADLVVNGRLVGHGDVVVVEENFGIRITKLIRPEDRIAAL